MDVPVSVPTRHPPALDKVEAAAALAGGAGRVGAPAETCFASASTAPPRAPTSDAAAAPLPAGAVVRRMLRLAWRYRGQCLLTLLLQLLLLSVSMGGLQLTGVAIDVLRHHLDPASVAPRFPWGSRPPEAWPPLKTVAVLSGCVLLVALLNASLRYLAAVTAAVLNQRVIVHLRAEVFRTLQQQSFRYFDSHDISSTINRIAIDAPAISSFIDGVVLRCLVIVITLGIYLAYMLSVHVRLTLACLACSPLLWSGAMLFSRAVQPAYLRINRLTDALVLALAENLHGMAVVKAFARQREQAARFAAAARHVQREQQRVFWKLSLFQPTMGLLTQTSLIVLLAYGGYLVIQQQLPLGAGMFVFAGLLQEFANRVSQMTDVANSMQTSLTGARRVFELLDAPAELASPPGTSGGENSWHSQVCQRLSGNRRETPQCSRTADLRTVAGKQCRGVVKAEHRCRASSGTRRGGLRFEHVSFFYRAGQPVLHDVSFEIRPGQCVAVVGETGSGKSTLLSLVPRFYDASSGRVLLDNIDVCALRLENLRRSIGMVFQESFLFNDTVRANIALGRPEASLEEIDRAAGIAGAREFILRMPGGYDARIEEQGANLSGGQRQRLAIARAVLMDPPILILDDATAAVDPGTESQIQQAIEGAMRGRTTLLVANRISMLCRADRILVLAGGRIDRIGTHEQLLQTCPRYRRLVALQAVHLEEPRR